MNKGPLQNSNIAKRKGVGKNKTNADRMLAKARIGGFARSLLAYHIEQIGKDPKSTEHTIPNLINNLERVILMDTGNACFINPSNGRILQYELETDILLARYMPIEHIRFTDSVIAIYPQALPASVMNRLIAKGTTRNKHGHNAMALSELIDIPMLGYNPLIMDIRRNQNSHKAALLLHTLRDVKPWLEVRNQILTEKKEDKI